VDLDQVQVQKMKVPMPDLVLDQAQEVVAVLEVDQVAVVIKALTQV